jgi:hypothetical protein
MHRLPAQTLDETSLLNRRFALPLLAFVSVFALAPSALADPDPASPLRLPVAVAERPLTIPSLILNPNLDSDVTRIPDVGGAATYGNVGLAATFGITDDLEVRALVLPLQLAGPPGNGFHYGETSENRGPSVGATYRFVRGVVELGAGLDIRGLTALGISGVAIIPDLALRIHAGKKVRIDIGAQLNITRASSTADMLCVPTPCVASGASVPANMVRLAVPLSALYNIIDAIDVGVTTGLTIDNFSEWKTSTGIPVGIFAGYAIAGRQGPILDIEPFFTFPYLVMPWTSPVTNSGEYVVGLNLGGFIYL